MMDIRQSPQYARYLEILGWKIEKINGCQVFIKQFPFFGSIVKIQRPKTLPPIEKIFLIIKKYRAFQVSIEPLQLASKYGFKQAKFPYLPTKTIHIDLTRSEDQIFANFSSSKRRDIRKAIRDNVVVKESKKIDDFVVLKNAQHGFSGKILRVDKQFKALWQAFRPKRAVLLLAYPSTCATCATFSTLPPFAGILLLFYDQIAYYYQAASTKQGNKIAAPSSLVWEALKLAKKRNCKTFDFEGIYDPRFPQKSWLGFTRFKRGFGGKEITYPPPLVKTIWRLI